MAEVLPQPAPAGLGERGSALWESITADVAEDGRELDPRELALLRLAAEAEDRIGQLEAVVDETGVMVVGSTGQPVVHGAVPEARLQRVLIRQLLAGLNLDGEPVAVSQGSLRARHAAEARWNRRDELEQRRARARGAS